LPLAVEGIHIISDPAGEVGILGFDPAFAGVGGQVCNVHPFWTIGGLPVQSKTFLIFRQVVDVQLDVASIYRNS
jgi:hypothetical protein